MVECIFPGNSPFENSAWARNGENVTGRYKQNKQRVLHCCNWNEEETFFNRFAY